MSARATVRGLFISVEGGDGAGKSSQIRRLAARLEAMGRKVVVTREPGGSPGAEAIRELLLNGPTERWSALTEALMMNAARTEHLEKLIRPALARGEVVITDRFADSTMAYQGVAGALGVKTVEALEDIVVGDDEPDLTLILDVPVSVGLARAAARRGADMRFENKGADYQERVRRAFQKIAADNPRRCVLIDAARDEAAVFESVAAAVDKVLKARS